MELRSSALWPEIEAIAFSSGIVPNIYSWSLEFKVGNKTYQPLKLISIDNLRNYVGAYGDEIVVEVVMGAGDFVFDIYPNRKNLMVNLFCHQNTRAEGIALLTQDIQTQTLRAVLVDDHSETVAATNSAQQSKHDLNRMSIRTVRFQLIDQALEYARLQTVQASMRQTSVGDCLEYLLTALASDANLDEDNRILGVDMVPPANTDKLKQIVIPPTRLPSLRDFLQQKVSGLYSAGIGMYLQSRVWYVFPLFDLSRFSKSMGSLTVINIPANQYPSIERTYRKTANQLIVLCTGEVRHIDKTESMLQNDGNGVRYMDARMVMEHQPSIGGNKAVLSRSAVNNEFITEDRPTGLNNVTMSAGGSTANKFAEMSKMAARYGSVVECMWENSDPGALKPGMPVKFLYLKEGQVAELHGTLFGAHHYTQTYGQGITDLRHITNSALQLFVQREDIDDNWRDQITIE